MTPRLALYRGKWVATWNDGGVTRRHSFRTADREKAERLFRDFKIDNPADTIATSVGRYLAIKRDRARSYAAMEASWKALAPMFAHLRPDQISVPLCRAFAKLRRGRGLSNGTIIKDLSFLRAAVGGKGEFEFPPTPPPRTRCLSQAEFAALLAACQSPHLRLFCILAMTTAGRTSAILDLTWDRVDFDRGLINLKLNEDVEGLKGRAEVAMNELAREALEKAYKIRTAVSGHVIEYAGHRVYAIKKAFKRATKRAKLKNVTPHVLRHTAAVWMIEAGVRLEEVSQFLGHTDHRVTFRVYARFRPEHMQKAAAALKW